MCSNGTYQTSRCSFINNSPNPQSTSITTTFLNRITTKVIAPLLFGINTQIATFAAFATTKYTLSLPFQLLLSYPIYTQYAYIFKIALSKQLPTNPPFTMQELYNIATFVTFATFAKHPFFNLAYTNITYVK